MTEQRPQVTRRENLLQNLTMWFLKYASGQTDRHTDMLIAMLHPPTWGNVNKYSWDDGNNNYGSYYCFMAIIQC